MAIDYVERILIDCHSFIQAVQMSQPKNALLIDTKTNHSALLIETKANHYTLIERWDAIKIGILAFAHVATAAVLLTREFDKRRNRALAKAAEASSEASWRALMESEHRRRKFIHKYISTQVHTQVHTHTH